MTEQKQTVEWLIEKYKEISEYDINENLGSATSDDFMFWRMALAKTILQDLQDLTPKKPEYVDVEKIMEEIIRSRIWWFEDNINKKLYSQKNIKISISDIQYILEQHFKSKPQAQSTVQEVGIYTDSRWYLFTKCCTNRVRRNNNCCPTCWAKIKWVD